MIVTLGQARIAVADFAGKAGKCASSDENRAFVMTCLKRALMQGAYGNLREWEFCTQRGCFTLPPDLAVPLKVTIFGYPERVWSKWYNYYDSAPRTLKGCKDAIMVAPGIIEESNDYFTVYDLPPCGARISAIPLGQEAPDANIIIQGVDRQGRQISVDRNGTMIGGEYLSINKDKPTFSTQCFIKITGVQKTRTKNYVRLYWYVPETKEQGLLAEYRPNDTNPVYRRYRVPVLCDDKRELARVRVLGRVADPDYYHDNDVLPITNLDLLQKVAQTIQSETNKDFVSAGALEKISNKLIDDENQYNRLGEESYDLQIAGQTMENLQ